MPAYVLLLAPSSNRVYAGDAPAITAAELEVLASASTTPTPIEVDEVEIAGVRYLRAVLDANPDARPAADLLGPLAAGHAAFEVVEGDLLRPVALHRSERLDDDLLSIPKYPGKTNEQLTRTLLNVTLASADVPGLTDRRATVLDPLAGRGTTLSWALSLGHDAIGVEVERREVEAYAAFLTTWLRRKRMKHQIDLKPLRRNGVHLGEVLEAQLSPDREAYATGDRQHLTVFAADTTSTAELLQRRRVDVVVTDAPYGVAHGSRTGGRAGAGGRRDRSPAQLLEEALPGWVSVLRPGGAVGIAWNTHGLARGDLAALCRGVGLEVRDDGPWLRFAHRVDAGIHRDLLVATKPV